MRLVRPMAFGAAVLAAVACVSNLLGLGLLGTLAAAAAAILGIVAGFFAVEKQEDPLLAQAQVVDEAPPAWALSVSLSQPDRVEAKPSLEFPELDDARKRLHFARAVAGKVPQLTEDAAFALIERFESMRGNTSKASVSARLFKAALTEGVGSGHPPVAIQAEQTRHVIKSQRESIALMAEHSRQSSKDLRSMGKELESGMDLLKSIEEITERSRLIAFNMAVEAARIGEKGRGFKVIVGELRKLNDMTADFSGQVAELLGRFRDYNASIVGRLALETDRVSRDVAGGMEAAERAVESLIAASGTADSFAHEIAALAVVIDSDLDGVLESLQFQDITRQMIEGSNAMLDEASADIDASLTAIGRLDAARRNVILLESIRKTLLARSKTRGEKEAIMEVKE
ncbi:MAG: methyl-accepting chemotaxis protein [Rectinemataceae bacterium]